MHWGDEHRGLLRIGVHQQRFRRRLQRIRMLDFRRHLHIDWWHLLRQYGHLRGRGYLQVGRFGHLHDYGRKRRDD